MNIGIQIQSEYTKPDPNGLARERKLCVQNFTVMDWSQAATFWAQRKGNDVYTALQQWTDPKRQRFGTEKRVNSYSRPYSSELSPSSKADAERVNLCPRLYSNGLVPSSNALAQRKG